MLSEMDRALLQRMQGDFPVCDRPYARIAEEVGMTEQECLSRLQTLQSEGWIRRFGAILDSKTLGYASTLCAMKVAQEDVPAVGEIINHYEAVTHNYVRNHPYNIWFTLIAADQKEIQRLSQEIELTTQYEVHTLPAKKRYKINVQFQVHKER
ncbi:siroheme decarboxylase subunit alpha [Marinicrinis sediminis]|uniref:siroheme decarboxylase n=1 Tax=Marinicrinis sediminis TaxID=1652465 RepID=A0ABW5RGV6_9BACL